MVRAQSVTSRLKIMWTARCLASVLVLGLLSASASAQRNARVLHRNVAELVSDAHVVILGSVANVRAEAHPQYENLQTIVVTVNVKEVWKGQAGSTYTFRAFVDHPLDFKQKLGYGDGQDMVLMLTRPSDIGLSSPAGLEQGRFRVRTDASGNRSIVNGIDNMGLFRNMQKSAPKLDAQLAGTHARQLVSQHKGGAVAFDDFRTIVQTLVIGSQQ